MNNKEITTNKCPFCNSTKYKKNYLIKSQISGKRVDYYKCKKCKSIKQIPTPDKKTIEDYYSKYKQIKEIMHPGYLIQSNKNILFNERKKSLEEIKFNITNIIDKENLEFGCANGAFLYYLKNHGAKSITGIDLSSQLINEIEDSSFNLKTGDLSQIEKKSVDNLFMFNILEHVLDFEKELLLGKDILKDGGNFIIELPLAGFVSKSFGKKWRFLLPDEHINIPSYKGLKKIFKRHNIKIIGKTRFGSGYTLGMIHPKQKKIADYLAKQFNYGDRITIYCKIK